MRSNTDGSITIPSEIAKIKVRPTVLTTLFNRGIDITVPEGDTELKKMATSHFS